jgi:hypothetical protein
MRVGFTGARAGMTTDQGLALRGMLVQVRREYGAYAFHHGQCVGADEQAASIADELGFLVVSHPPTDWVLRSTYPAHITRDSLGYLERDREIVHESTALIACPASDVEQPRGGTWYTIRYARKVRHPLTVIGPGGAVIEQSNWPIAPVVPRADTG